MYKFYINGQKIVAEVPTSVSDTIDWLTAEFKFSDDWQGLDKWAHFKNGTTTYDINLVEDKITADMHLNLGAGLWKVYLHGNAYDGDDVVQRAVTDSCMIRVKQADTLSGQPLPTVPPSATEQILAKVSNASNKAYAAALSASSAQASAASAQTSASQAAASASGKYTKPSGGIPKTDLASAVQTSLEKAESALQEHQSLSAYRTASDQDEIDNGIAEDINELVDTVEIIDESKYEKPQGGIPSTDMSEAVQTSLGKADTALQEHQSLSAYRTSAEQDVIDSEKVSDIKINGTSIVDDNGVGIIPIASNTGYGVVRPWSDQGTKVISVSGQMLLSTERATNANIDTRNQYYRPIVPANLDYAVKSAMCDGRGADWSEAEQKACRKRIGMPTDWVFKGTISGDSTDRGNIDGGLIVDMTGCTEFCVVGTCTTSSGTTNLYTKIDGVSSSYLLLYNIKNNFKALFVDGYNGYDCIAAMAGSTFQYMGSSMAGYSNAVGRYVKDVIKFTISGTSGSSITACQIDFYAR